MAESGFNDRESSTWQSLMSPAGTPPAIIGFLHKEVVSIVTAPGAREQLIELGFNAIANQPAQLMQLMQLIQTEIERWRKVIQSARMEA